MAIETGESSHHHKLQAGIRERAQNRVLGNSKPTLTSWAGDMIWELGAFVALTETQVSFSEPVWSFTTILNPSSTSDLHGHHAHATYM